MTECFLCLTGQGPTTVLREQRALRAELEVGVADAFLFRQCRAGRRNPVSAKGVSRVIGLRFKALSLGGSRALADR